MSFASSESPKPKREPTPIERVAFDWLARRDRGLTPAEQTQLAGWLAADPRYARAFSDSDRTWSLLNRMGELSHSSDAPSFAARSAGLARPVAASEGVRTIPVDGAYTPLEALKRMLSGTDLTVTRDQQTGTLAIKPVNGAQPQSTNTKPGAAIPPLSTRKKDEPMKTRNLVSVLTGWLVLVGVTPPGAHAAEAGGARTGTVGGQVSNTATSAFLEGARVAVQGSEAFALTDREGRFRLVVPAGNPTLQVTYTGLDPQAAAVAVAAGGVVTQNFALTSGIYVLDALTVAGEREGSARAVTLQREAPNVKNIVATDAFGNLANGNVGDFLQRLPGITGVFVGSEVVGVSIRGMAAGQNAVMMDGDRVASSDSANAGRGFVFEQTSLNLIESVEVTKAPTPDMDADSMGGNVNMVTKSAFDRKDAQFFSYAVGFSHRWGRRAPADSWYKEPIDGVMPSLNFTYSNLFGARRNIGLMLTGTWHVQATTDIRSDLAQQSTLNRPAYTYSVSDLLIGSPRSRFSLGAKLDYKLSEQTIVTLNTSYSWMHDSQVTQQRTLATSQALATFDASGNRTGTGTIRPDYAETFTEVLTSTNSLSTLTVTTVDKTGGTYQFKPSVRHRFDGGRLLIDYNASWSRSNTWYDAHPYGAKYKDQPKGTVSVTLRNLGWTVDRRRSLTYPDITQTAGPDMNNLANYSGLLLTQPNRAGEDEILGTRFNLRRAFDFTVPTVLKTGFNYRRQERALENNSRRYNYAGPASIGKWVNNTGRYSELVKAYRREVPGYVPPPFPDAYAIAEHARDVPAEWTEDITFRYSQYFANLRSMTEEVGGFYAMGDVRLGRLSALGGFRVEETRTSGQGPLQALTPAEVARRAAWVGTVTAAEAERRVRAEYTGRLEGSASYRSVFPGLHLKYEARHGLVFRLSHSNGIGRPDFGSIMPNSSVSFAAQTVTLSNPALKPQYSENYDASIEYYFEPVGLLSIGAFSKDISDFIFQDRSRLVGTGAGNGFDGEYAGYNLITSANGGSARYRGVEISFQQQLTFLPGIWKRFGLNANYTYLSTEGNYGGAAVSTVVAGFKPRTANLGISYRGSKTSVIVQGNWVGTWLVSNSTNAALLRYEKPRTQIDVKTQYKISRRLGLFCDIENLLSAPLNANYLTFTDRSGQTRLTAPKIVAGVQGRF